MTLPTIELDDLDWAAFTQTSRESIAGASNGQWTLHAPVDPGVTLLELFASQLEQANDVFYFGHVLADVNIGNTATRYRLNADDVSAIRTNQSGFPNTRELRTRCCYLG